MCFQDASTRPTGVTYEAPSLTPYSDYFPAYRVYEIEGRYDGSEYVRFLIFPLLVPW